MSISFPLIFLHWLYVFTLMFYWTFKCNFQSFQFYLCKTFPLPAVPCMANWKALNGSWWPLTRQKYHPESSVRLGPMLRAKPARGSLMIVNRLGWTRDTVVLFSSTANLIRPEIRNSTSQNVLQIHSPN